MSKIYPCFILWKDNSCILVCLEKREKLYELLSCKLNHDFYDALCKFWWSVLGQRCTVEWYYYWLKYVTSEGCSQCQIKFTAPFNHELLFWKDIASTAKTCPSGYPFLKSVTILCCPVVSSWIAMYFWPLFWVWFLFPLQKLNSKCIRVWTLRGWTPAPAFSVRAVHWLNSQQL